MTPYYDDGQCVIYHGDCLDVLPTLSRPTAIVTDPPYGLGDIMVGGKNKWPNWAEGSQRKTGLTWDQEVPAIVTTFPDLADHCVIWGGNYFPLPPRRGWLVWDKIVRNFSSGHCELAWTTINQPVRAFNFAHGELASEGKLHPTQKPRRLMSWCLGFVAEGDVIDPFMGSGTTLVAAKHLGRKAIGIELEERYCEIAANRLAQGVLDFGASA